MNRRYFIKSSVAFAALSAGTGFLNTTSGHAEVMERVTEFPGFPYELFEISGKDLPKLWKKLHGKQGVTPVVLGDSINFKRIADNVSSLGEGSARRKQIKVTVTAAKSLVHPKSIFDLQQNQLDKKGKNYDKKIGNLVKNAKQETKDLADIFKRSMNEADAADIGSWPTKMPPDRKFDFSHFVNPAQRVYLALIPTKDQSEIPAYLGFGGWGSCPADEYHVSALRSWKKRYGAELITLGSDTLKLRVKKRPGDKKEALELAKEQYAYCKHIVDKDKATISDLAANLMTTDEWLFWWE